MYSLSEFFAETVQPIGLHEETVFSRALEGAARKIRQLAAASQRCRSGIRQDETSSSPDGVQSTERWSESSWSHQPNCEGRWRRNNSAKVAGVDESRKWRESVERNGEGRDVKSVSQRRTRCEFDGQAKAIGRTKNSDPN